MIKESILRISCFILIMLSIAGCRFKESSSNGQEIINISSQKDNYEKTCEWGTKEAIKDFKAGKLMLYRYGLEVEDASPYWEALEKDYKIYVKSRLGCVIAPSYTCYNDYMKAKINEKYGADFFKILGEKFSE